MYTNNKMTYLYLAIICIIVGYVYCYFIYPSNVSIIQTSLKEFDFNLLLKRQPLVIEDTIKDVLLVINSWFSPNIIKDVMFDDKRIWNVNYHKYLYVYALQDTEILLCSASHKVTEDLADTNELIIAIKLKRHQSVIIPFRWHYNIKNINSVKLYGIHDYVTYALDFFI